MADGRLELRSWWPVREVRTPRVGQFAADLRGELATAGSEDPGADLAVVAELVSQLGPDDAGRDHTAGAECEGDLTSRTLRSAYPLLSRPLELGARPEQVPVVLEALLRHTDVRAAARATLRPQVTRPLVRAVATALLPDDAGLIVWEPLQCALMAAMRCGPEQITSILSTPVHRPGAVAFSVGDVDRARAMFEGTNPRRVSETLQAALADAGGTARLATQLAEWDARPPAPPPALAPAPRDPPPQRPEREPDLVDHPPEWVATEGSIVAGHRVVLPRTGNELLEWGAAMDNCIGIYRHVVVTGQTRIMGFTSEGRLRVAAEVSRGRVLRQLEARGNSRPTPALDAAIVGFLRERRLIETDARRR